jgi:hypothetical protein
VAFVTSETLGRGVLRTPSDSHEMPVNTDVYVLSEADRGWEYMNLAYQDEDELWLKPRKDQSNADSRYLGKVQAEQRS